MKSLLYRTSTSFEPALNAIETPVDVVEPARIDAKSTLNAAKSPCRPAT
ncbi:MAG: hypothetical protein WA709_18625 [Stellaceae bacterium]